MYYTELSPAKRDLQDWFDDNPTLLPVDYEELSVQDLLVVYRREIIGDLTGLDGGKRQAKFIYDLSDVVSLMFRHIQTTRYSLS